MINDMIADALTRIRNASLRRLDVTTLLHSNTVEAVLNVLQAKGYIDSFKVVEGDNNKKTISVVLKYDDNGKTVINEVVRVSKPGRRVYKGYTELKSFKNGYGTIVVSTNKGVISNDEAYAAKVGGEVLCTIW
ncbi:MAG: 30S ribosomal protein S8 [Arcobacteraceae bacterium]|jgi:small subunit ribosomal protein S8|nr:30S ribosomal protein S8 [Arcobacteraceae bacterium]